MKRKTKWIHCEVKENKNNRKINNCCWITFFNDPNNSIDADIQEFYSWGSVERSRQQIS